MAAIMNYRRKGKQQRLKEKQNPNNGLKKKMSKKEDEARKHPDLPDAKQAHQSQENQHKENNDPQQMNGEKKRKQVNHKFASNRSLIPSQLSF